MSYGGYQVNFSRPPAPGSNLSAFFSGQGSVNPYGAGGSNPTLAAMYGVNNKNPPRPDGGSTQELNNVRASLGLDGHQVNRTGITQLQNQPQTGGQTPGTGGFTNPVPGGFGGSSSGGFQTGGQFPGTGGGGDFMSQIMDLINQRKQYSDQAESELRANQGEAEQAIKDNINSPLSQLLQTKAIERLQSPGIDNEAIKQDALRRAAADRVSGQQAMAQRGASAGIRDSKFMANLQQNFDRNLAGQTNRTLANLDFQNAVDNRNAQERALQLGGQVKSGDLAARGTLADVLERFRIDVDPIDAQLGQFAQAAAFLQGGPGAAANTLAGASQSNLYSGGGIHGGLEYTHNLNRTQAEQLYGSNMIDNSRIGNQFSFHAPEREARRRQQQQQQEQQDLMNRLMGFMGV